MPPMTGTVSTRGERLPAAGAGPRPETGPAKGGESIAAAAATGNGARWERGPSTREPPGVAVLGYPNAA